MKETSWIVLGIAVVGLIWYLGKTNPINTQLATIQSSTAETLGGISSATSITNNLISALTS